MLLFFMLCCSNEGERHNTLSGVFVPFDPLNSLHFFFNKNSGLNDSNFRIADIHKTTISTQLKHSTKAF